LRPSDQDDRRKLVRLPQLSEHAGDDVARPGFSE
jgi:hypothetical protein